MLLHAFVIFIELKMCIYIYIYIIYKCFCSQRLCLIDQKYSKNSYFEILLQFKITFLFWNILNSIYNFYLFYSFI